MSKCTTCGKEFVHEPRPEPYETCATCSGPAVSPQVQNKIGQFEKVCVECGSAFKYGGEKDPAQTWPDTCPDCQNILDRVYRLMAENRRLRTELKRARHTSPKAKTGKANPDVLRKQARKYREAIVWLIRGHTAEELGRDYINWRDVVEDSPERTRAVENLETILKITKEIIHSGEKTHG